MATWIYFFFFSLASDVLSVDVPMEEVNCTIYKDVLADAVSSFTSCAIIHSRPIKLCEQCVDNYIDMLESYRNLSKLRDSDGPCIDGFVNLDRLQIVETLYENSRDLWNRAKCYECFQIVDGQLTNNSSVETDTFNSLHTNFTTCTQRNDVNATTLCSICMDPYTALNNYYISISNENERIGVCMDIVDVMNHTRADWSTNCCRFRHKDERIFIVSTIFVSFTTILFYILTKVCSEKKAPIILKQTRFAGSFNQVFN